MFMYGTDTRATENFETQAPTCDDGVQALLSHLLETGALELREVEHEGKKLWAANVHFVLSLEDFHENRQTLLDRLLTRAEALKAINTFPRAGLMHVGATYLGRRDSAQAKETA